MQNNTPEVICESNLSLAWGRLLLAVMHARNSSLNSALLSIQWPDGDLPPEDPNIRTALDNSLKQNGKRSCSETASTIFPYNAWLRKGRPSCRDFCAWYLSKYLPRHKARVKIVGGKISETYFERMIAFGASHQQGGTPAGRFVEQLNHICRIWHRDAANGRRPRRSALQIACFDPAKDHTGSALSGFPCLQQVSFSYGDASVLAINAYYPTQYVFDRAYGNYLGLCQLGQFMAHELKQKLVRLNCFIGHPELGIVRKPSLRGLQQEVVRAIRGIDDSGHIVASTSVSKD